MLVKIYTDGAARGNPDGPGGYGTVLESTRRDSFIRRNCPRDMRRQRITEWS